MRTALRIVLEGSTILLLACFSVALQYALRPLRSQRAVSMASGANGLAISPVTQARRPVFLSRKDLP